MSYFWTLVGIAAVHLLAAISPGPAFVVITRIAVSQSRRAALATGLGAASGALVWASLASLGVHLLLSQAVWLYGALKLVGGAYLLWLGIQAWRHAEAPLSTAGDGAPAMSVERAWRVGLLTNLSNPKVIVFFGSIFVTLFEPGTPIWVWLAALVIVAANESLWFCLLALLFSSGPAQSLYRRAKTVIERVTGAAMVVFGLRLLAGLRL
jgi:RhtB (resistance to homoserine/threonine) family protein